MSTTLKRAEDPSASLREQIEVLAQAIRRKDIDALMPHYAPDVVVYDVRPPLDVQGADAYRKNFERWFASMQGSIDYEMNDPHISMSDTQAFCFFLAHITGTKTGGQMVDYWVRVTTCFREVRGRWLVTHEHVSMPASM